jgi:hypothetical protein
MGGLSSKGLMGLGLLDLGMIDLVGLTTRSIDVVTKGPSGHFDFDGQFRSSSNRQTS